MALRRRSRSRSRVVVIMQGLLRGSRRVRGRCRASRRGGRRGVEQERLAIEAVLEDRVDVAIRARAGRDGARAHAAFRRAGP